MSSNSVLAISEMLTNCPWWVTGDQFGTGTVHKYLPFYGFRAVMPFAGCRYVSIKCGYMQHRSVVLSPIDTREQRGTRPVTVYQIRTLSGLGPSHQLMQSLHQTENYQAHTNDFCGELKIHIILSDHFT